MNYRDLNWSTISKSISIFLLLVIMSFGIVGDSWDGSTALANGSPIKVMPLGDSITVGKYSGPIVTSPAGDYDDIGYREDLYNLLTGVGYSVDFVGTNFNGVISDPDHEGHNGFTDSQIATNIYNNGGENWLTIHSPDLVLLHIGTNSLDTDPSDVEDILQEIDDYESATANTVKVIVARIIDWVPNNPSVHTFSNEVENMVKDRPDYGTDLFVVDMESQAGMVYKIQPAGDMIDSLHPFATGYSNMADCWKHAFDKIYGSASTNNLPEFDNPIGNQTNVEGDTITPKNMGAADNDSGDTLTYSALNLPNGLTINSSTGAISGTISGSASNESPYYVAIAVSDGNPCGSTRHIFYWTVNELNYSPVIQTSVEDRTDNEGDYVQIDIDANDPNDTNLTYSATNLPTGININLYNGLIAGVIGYTASDQAQFPDFPVEVTVADDGNPPLEDSISFTWTVNDVVTDAPVVNNPGNQRNKTGDNISLQIIASDPEGEDISFIAENLPGNLGIDLNSGEITGEIAEWSALASPYSVNVTVTDESARSTQINFTWFVSMEEVYLPLVLRK